MAHTNGDCAQPAHAKRALQQRGQTLNMDVKKITLELKRANCTVRRQAALVYIGLRTRRMFAELWKWLFLHCRTEMEEDENHRPIKNVEEFKNLMRGVTGAPENLDGRISQYCTKHENRFLLCILLACIQSDTAMSASEHRINERMMCLHSTTVHSLCSVPVLLFDRYWSRFVVAVTEEVHRLMEDPSSEYYTRGPTPLATAYLREHFSRLLSEFYWEYAQQLTDSQNNHIFNGHEESARTRLRTMLGLYNTHGSSIDDAQKDVAGWGRRQRQQDSAQIPDVFARI